MATADISPPEAAPPPEGAPGPGWRRAVLPTAVLAAALGVVLVALSVVRIGGELTRPPTRGELDKAALAEVAGRWRSWPAGRIFPAALPYRLDVGGAETAARIGIGADTRCQTAVDAPSVPALQGCRAVIRATYLDQLQGLAITIGVAAFPDAATAARAAAQLSRRTPTLKALSFTGSVVARFNDAARQSGAVRQRGPYVVLTAIGYADGRPAARARQKQSDVFAIEPQLADAVLAPLALPSRPRCSGEGWKC